VAYVACAFLVSVAFTLVVRRMVEALVGMAQLGSCLVVLVTI
jgi:hypothetical protein